MKISTIKICILLASIIILFIQSISIATYQTAVLGERNIKNVAEIKERVQEDEVYLTKEEQETLNLINEYRKQNGLEELTPLSKLQKVAKIKAEDLVANEYFSHTSERLGTPFDMLEKNDVSYTIAGENLVGNTTPKRAVEAWINSPSHRENILEEEFQYTGIKVIHSPIYGKIFVQLFIGIE